MLYVYILIAGFCGGALRGIIGYTKYKTSYKEVKFEWKYFLFMVGVSGIAGLITAAVIRETNILPTMVNPAIAFIVGYAGGDFLENIYKIIGRKPFIIDLPKVV